MKSPPCEVLIGDLVGNLDPKEGQLNEANEPAEELKTLRLLEPNPEAKDPLRDPTVHSCPSTSSQERNERLSPPVSPPRFISFPRHSVSCGGEEWNVRVKSNNACTYQGNVYPGLEEMEDQYNGDKVLEAPSHQQSKSAGRPTQPFKSNSQRNEVSSITEGNRDNKFASSRLGDDIQQLLGSSSNDINNSISGNQPGRNRKSSSKCCQGVIGNSLCSTSRDVPHWFLLVVVGVLSAMFFYMPWSTNLMQIIFIALTVVIGIVCSVVYYISSKAEARLAERKEFRLARTVCQHHNGLRIFPSYRVLPGTAIWTVNYHTDAHYCLHSEHWNGTVETELSKAIENCIPPPLPVLPHQLQLSLDHTCAPPHTTNLNTRDEGIQDLQNSVFGHSNGKCCDDDRYPKEKEHLDHESATTSVVVFPTPTQSRSKGDNPRQRPVPNRKCACFSREIDNSVLKASQNGWLWNYWIQKSYYRQTVPAFELLLLGLLLLLSPLAIGGLTDSSFIFPISMREGASPHSAVGALSGYGKFDPSITEFALSHSSRPLSRLKEWPPWQSAVKLSVSLASSSQDVATQKCSQGFPRWKVAFAAEAKICPSIHSEAKQSEDVALKPHKLPTATAVMKARKEPHMASIFLNEAAVNRSASSPSFRHTKRFDEGSRARVLRKSFIKSVTQSDDSVFSHISNEIVLGVCLLHAWVFFLFDIAFIVEFIVGIIHLGTLMLYYPFVSTYHIFLGVLWLVIPILCMLPVYSRYLSSREEIQRKANSAMPDKAPHRDLSNRATIFHLCFTKGSGADALSKAEQSPFHQVKQAVAMNSASVDANNPTKRTSTEILDEIIFHSYSTIEDYSPPFMEECHLSMSSNTIHRERLLSPHAAVCESLASESSLPHMSQGITAALNTASSARATERLPSSQVGMPVIPNQIGRKLQNPNAPSSSLAKHQEPTSKDTCALVCFEDSPRMNLRGDNFSGYELDKVASDRNFHVPLQRPSSVSKANPPSSYHLPPPTAPAVGPEALTRADSLEQMITLSFNSAVLYRATPCRRPGPGAAPLRKREGSDGRGAFTGPQPAPTQPTEAAVEMMEGHQGAEGRKEGPFVGPGRPPPSGSLFPSGEGNGDDEAAAPFMVLDCGLVILEVSVGMAALLGTVPALLRLRRLPEMLAWLAVEQAAGVVLSLRELLTAATAKRAETWTGAPMVSRLTLRGHFPVRKEGPGGGGEDGAPKDGTVKSVNCGAAKDRVASRVSDTFAVSLDAWLEVSPLAAQSCDGSDENVPRAALLVLCRPPLHEVCDELPVPLALLNPCSGEILFWNRYAERLTETRSYDLLGWPLFSHLYPIPHHTNSPRGETRGTAECTHFPLASDSVRAAEKSMHNHSVATDRTNGASAQLFNGTKAVAEDTGLPPLALHGLLRIPIPPSAENIIPPSRDVLCSISREGEPPLCGQDEVYCPPNDALIRPRSQLEEVEISENNAQGEMWFQCCLRPLHGAFYEDECGALVGSAFNFPRAQFDESIKSRLSKQPPKGETDEFYGITSSRSTAFGMFEHYGSREEAETSSCSQCYFAGKNKNDIARKNLNTRCCPHYLPLSAAALLERDLPSGNPGFYPATGDVIGNVNGKSGDRASAPSNMSKGESKSLPLRQQTSNSIYSNCADVASGHITSPSFTFLQTLRSLMRENAPLMLVLEHPVSPYFFQPPQPSASRTHPSLKPHAAVGLESLSLQFLDAVRAAVRLYKQDVKNNMLKYSELDNLLPEGISRLSFTNLIKESPEVPPGRSDSACEKETTPKAHSMHDQVVSPDVLHLTHCLKTFVDQIIHITDHYDKESATALQMHMSPNLPQKLQHPWQREHHQHLKPSPTLGGIFLVSPRRGMNARLLVEGTNGAVNPVSPPYLDGGLVQISSGDVSYITVPTQGSYSMRERGQQYSKDAAQRATLGPKNLITELASFSGTPPKPPVSAHRLTLDDRPPSAANLHSFAPLANYPSILSVSGDSKDKPLPSFTSLGKHCGDLQETRKFQGTSDERDLLQSHLRSNYQTLLYDGSTPIELSSPLCELDRSEHPITMGGESEGNATPASGSLHFGHNESAHGIDEVKGDSFGPTSEGLEWSVSRNLNTVGSPTQPSKSNAQSEIWAMLLSRDEATIPTCRIRVPLGEEFCFGRSSTCHAVVSDTFVSSLQFKIKRTMNSENSKGSHRRQKCADRTGSRETDAADSQALKGTVVTLYDCSVNGTYVNVKKIGKGKHCILRNNALITFRLSTSQFFMGFVFVLTDAHGLLLRNRHIDPNRKANRVGLRSCVSRWKDAHEAFSPSSSFTSISCKNAVEDGVAPSVDAVSSKRRASSRPPSTSDTSSLSSTTHNPARSHDAILSDRHHLHSVTRWRNFPSGRKAPRRETIEWKIGEEMLGKGGNAEVYLGINLTNGQLIAVKRVRLPDTLEDRDNAEAKSILQQYRSLKEEITVLTKAVHPNIVRYYGSSQNPSYFNILLEFVPGGSLRGLLDNFGALSPGVILSYLRQVLQGLVYLHQLNIVHSDIKTANILITEKGKVKLADFGTAKLLSRPHPTLVGAAQSSAPRRVLLPPQDGSPAAQEGGNGATLHLAGTLRWMDPALFRGDPTANSGPTKASDIWSVGCAMIEMMSGEAPWFEYEFESNEQIVNLLTYAQEPPEVPACPECPDLVKLSQQCLQIDPEKRPTGAELLQMVVASEQRFQAEAMLKSSASPPRVTSQPASGSSGDGGGDGGSSPNHALIPPPNATS